LTVYEIAPNAEQPDEYNVERIVEDGAIEVTIFSGPDAKSRAHDYALLMNVGAPSFKFVLYYVDERGNRTPIFGSPKKRPCLLAAGEKMPTKAQPVGPWSEGKVSKLQLSEGYGHFLLVEVD
jgi:hypothetical protein